MALKTPIKVNVYPSVVKNGDILTIETLGASGKVFDVDVVNLNGQIIKMTKNEAYTEYSVQKIP